ncbi:SdpI family protein [Streptococcus henryi]|uniref:SdpI family protein n=1 Tax=Streptococcus henryi TaxID=439219 RepID=UPI000366BBF6|nr:SdpI family protein [Streptococcus henryi]
MGFWVFMFIMTLLIPAALLLTWYMCPKFKTIHNASGYRTKRSMKNQDTWDFAQKHCSKISLYMFFPSLLLVIAIMPMVISKSIGIIGWIGFVITMIQMMGFAVIIISTEKALKGTFDENGNKL